MVPYRQSSIWQKCHDAAYCQPIPDHAGVSAETGPVFVSGKIRSIDANLQMVIDGKASGDSLAEAAEQARNLLEHIRNTGTNIRDITGVSAPRHYRTSQYVQRFFSDYIERVFIGDYRELRTSEHPLSKRGRFFPESRTSENLVSIGID